MISLLPHTDGVVTCIPDRVPGELFVLYFEFLKTKDIRFVSCEESEQTIMSSPDGVHVPSHDLERHGRGSSASCCEGKAGLNASRPTCNRC